MVKLITPGIDHALIIFRFLTYCFQKLCYSTYRIHDTVLKRNLVTIRYGIKTFTWRSSVLFGLCGLCFSSNYIRIKYSWTSNPHLFARISNLSAAMHVRQFSRKLQWALQSSLIPDETHATAVHTPFHGTKHGVQYIKWVAKNNFNTYV